ncbi:MAG: phage portal protein [Clostridiales bacterium]|nr:phage portal protein [Clostridiales bacterium]
MALYTSVTLIADLIAGCKIRVFEDNKPVKNEKWYVFNISANPNQTPAQVISDWITKMYIKGEALIVPLSKNLYVAESFSREEYPVKGDVFKNICIGSNFQSNRSFKADGVYYIRQSDPQIKKLFNSVFEVYADLLEYSKKASAQGSGEKYAMQIGDYRSGTPAEEKEYLDGVQERLATFVKADSAALPLTKNQTIQRLSSATATNSTDYTALRKDVYNIAAEILHLPAGLLDGSLTAVDQVLNQALTTAIDPLVNKINQELTRKTYSREQAMKGCRVFVDVSSIRHVDVIEKANEIYNLIASGVVCIDEARGLCRLPELNTDWSEKHYITKNYEEVGKTDPLEGGE